MFLGQRVHGTGVWCKANDGGSAAGVALRRGETGGWSCAGEAKEEGDDGDPVPARFGQRQGQNGGGDDSAVPGDAAAQQPGVRARRLEPWRLEGAGGQREAAGREQNRARGGTGLRFIRHRGRKATVERAE